MKPANERVVSAMNKFGIECDVMIFDRDTRTSYAAAEALGCSVSQIAKSLIFMTESQRAVLAITSGSNRVQLTKLAAIIGEKILKADAEFVRSVTGFAIGGVAPVGHANAITTLFDQDLFQYPVVWAAAGTPDSIFSISQENLYRLADGRIHDFAVPL